MEENVNEEIEKLSMKLFGKPSKEIKYCMVTNYIHKALIEGEDCLRTGLYSWLPVFNGEIKQYQEMDKSELDKYDIVHVNLSGQDIHTVGEIRDILGQNSKTKLVVNNDYTVELWQGSFDYYSTLAREINCADVLFGTEPNQVGALEVMTKRKVHLVVHPCFVKRLKTLTPEENPEFITVVWHRYDNYSAPPSLAVKDLGYKTRLIGYDPQVDTKRYITSCNYNYVLQGENFMDFCDKLRGSKVVVDPFTLTSQSRTGWDCAAMGVFLVGSDRNYSTQKCYPFTICDPFDIKKMRELVKRGIEDEEFRKKVIDYARNAVEYVSYENSKLKLLRAIEEGSPKIDI